MSTEPTSRLYQYTYKIRAILVVVLFFFGVAFASDINLTPVLEHAKSKYGDNGLAIVEQWSKLLEQAKSEQDTQKLKSVNDFFNKNIRYLDDDVIWQQKDYWATPLETLGLRKGDCEDYVIAKYFSLMMIGIEPNKLRLVYVKAKLNGTSQAHMVLAYYPTSNAIPLILDNLRYDILPALERQDLTPVYSFNSDGLWVGQEQTSRSNDPASRMSRWRDVLTRMKIEGF